MKSSVRVGIDIGGTFTDLVLLEGGGVHVAKVLTTPRDPAEGALNGFRRILEISGTAARDVHEVVHATTLVTNALIERTGAPAGVITTRGFADTLEIAREKRFDIYDIFLEIPSPLVPREFCLGVAERTDADGNVLCPVDGEEVADAAGQLRADGVQSVAINFLHSPSNPANEIAAEAAIRNRFPDLWVSRSSAIAPETGEFERCSTTAANAYVQPIVDRYLDRLTESLKSLGFGGRLSIMLSTGGFSGVEAVRRVPIRIVESGPAGGALAAAQLARSRGEARAIGFDMGGTTAKVCLIRDGEPDTVHSFEAARTARFQKGSGLPILAPSVDLVEIGAGGGSIAHVNRMGLVQVGPQSAGSEPGPACYGRGGVEPTVTDANLLLGYLNPEYFLGGEMPLSADSALEAVSSLAKALGMSSDEAAWGVHEIVTEQMASAARVHIAEKGADPRHFTLIATGGAGPAHACHMARKLFVRCIVCPPVVGVASTVGLLMARPRSDAVRALVSDLDAMNWEKSFMLVEDMMAQALEELGGEPIGGGEWEIALFADMRYRGQVGSISVPVSSEEGRPLKDEAGMKHRFEEDYLARFTRKIEGVPIEVCAWRLTMMGPQPETGHGEPFETESGAAHVKGSRRMFDGARRAFTDGTVYDRYALPAGGEFKGPAVIEERESAIVVPSDGTFAKDEAGNIVINLE